MSCTENRNALRVPCQLPIRLASQDRHFSGLIHNISRSGIYFSLPTRELGTDESTLLGLAHLVDELLGARFDGDLHFEALGPKVRKRLHLVRLGQSGAEPTVEIGCEFGNPLTDEETQLLGLGLPEVGVTTLDAYEAVVGDASPAYAPRGYDAYVHPTHGLPTEPLAGETLGMKQHQAVVKAPLSSELTGVEVPSMTIALTQAYGPSPVLEILDGLRMLWSGQADIRHVELTGPKSVNIHMEGRDA